MKKEILEKIKEYDKIIISRHVSPDPDAIGSQGALAEIIRATYPYKEVYTTGVYADRLKYLYMMDKLKDVDYDEALIIVTDTANKPRIDDKFHDLGAYLIKIDHHPLIDSYGDIEWVDDTASSTSEMILDFYLENNDELVLNTKAKELLFSGIVADTGRFLYTDHLDITFDKVSKIIGDINIKKVYQDMYARPLSEVRFQGYIAEHLEVSQSGFAYIKITDDIIQEYHVEPASASNMIGNFNNINEVLVWCFLTEDLQRNTIRINIRSRGPVINKVAEKHGGGGHPMAAGVRVKTFEEAEQLLIDLDEVCEEYMKSNY